MEDKKAITSQLLEKMSRRTYFKSLVYYDINWGNKFLRNNIYFMQQKYQEKLEVVGSLSDGLAVLKPYDIGDTDVLRISQFQFDSEDEKTFEYRENDPCFLQVPFSEKLKQKGVHPENGKYLSASLIRSQLPPFFIQNKVVSHGEVIPYYGYEILSGIQEITHDTKCARTVSTPYTDNVGGEPKVISPMEINFAFRLFWTLEHNVCAYLMTVCNAEPLKYIREILYGEYADDTEAVKELLKTHVAMLKLDHIANVFQDYDLLYFKRTEFMHLLDQVADKNETVVDNSIPSLHGEMSLDFVPAIPCKGWPRTAANFSKRQREWPSKEIVDKIIKTGYQIVPKSPDINPNSKLDFILSFSPAEKELAQHLPAKAREAYHILKWCYKTAGCKDGENKKVLKTFHLKTALFWVTEQTRPSDWEGHDMLWCVQHIVEFVLNGLLEKFLPSFFVEKANLIRSFSDKDILFMTQIFVCLTENLPGYIQLSLENDWEHLKEIMSKEGFETLVEQPEIYDELPWMERVKAVLFRSSSVGGYKTEEMGDEIDKKAHNPYTFFGKIAGEALNSYSLCHPLSADITEEQLEYAKIFVHTIQNLDMNLYHFISKDVGDDITNATADVIPNSILQEYPAYDPKHNKEFGLLLISTIKLRLKYYGNIFRAICDKVGEIFPPQVKNEDAKYIIAFLQSFRRHPNIQETDVQDLLFNLIYFCQYTKMRYHWLEPGHQILRSIREFLQDSKHLMTIFFNPKSLGPIPVVMPNKLKSILGGIEPKRTMCPVN